MQGLVQLETLEILKRSIEYLKRVERAHADAVEVRLFEALAGIEKMREELEDLIGRIRQPPKTTKGTGTL